MHKTERDLQTHRLSCERCRKSYQHCRTAEVLYLKTLKRTEANPIGRDPEEEDAVVEARAAYRKAERAFVANPTDETMAAMTAAEQVWIDAGEIAAGGTPGGFRLEWSI